MPAQITQVLTQYPDLAPQPTDSQDEFSRKAFSKVAHDLVLIPQLNALAGQANTVATEVNNNAQSAAVKAAEA